jgi:4-hydroxy-2-oxoheptanedioate aldolase
MNGAKLRERLSKGEAITMFNPHHVSPGLAARLVELGADSIFVD